MNKITTFEFADHVLGVIVNDELDEKLIGEIHIQIEKRIEKFGKIGLFMEIREGNKITFKALQRDLFFKIENSKNFKKIAVVTDSNRLRICTRMKEIFLDAEVEGFKLNDRLKTINWISH